MVTLHFQVWFWKDSRTSIYIAIPKSQALIWFYLQVTSNEKKHGVKTKTRPSGLEPTGPFFFWLQDYRLFLKQLRQLSAISCCKRLPSIGSVTHLITRGEKTTRLRRIGRKQIGNEWHWKLSMPKPSISICWRSWLHHHLHPPKPTIQRIFNIQPPCRHNSCCNYSLSIPCVPWVLPE